MNILLCVILIALIAINKVINKKILFPSVLVCIVFFLSAFLVYLNQRDWNFQISEKTLYIIIISLVVFSVGAFFGSKIILIGRRISKPFDENTMQISGMKIFVFTVVCVIIDYLYFRNQLELAIKLGGGSTLGDMFFYLRSNMKVKSDLYALSIGMNMGVSFVRAFGYVCLFLLIHRIVNRKKRIVRYIAPVVCLIICELLSSSRIGMIVIVSSSIFNVYFFLKKNNINIDKKIIKYSLAVVVVFFAVFYLFGQLTGQSAVYSAWETLSIYLGASIVCLDSFICFPWSDSGIFAQYSFKGINALLRRFGINIPSYSNHLPNVYFGNVGSNIYTAFFPFIHDFGIVASIFIQLILGFIFGITWTVYNKTEGISVFTIVYGRFFGYAVLMYSIAERLCSEYLALNVIVEIIFYYLIVAIIFDKSNVSEERL